MAIGVFSLWFNGRLACTVRGGGGMNLNIQNAKLGWLGRVYAKWVDQIPSYMTVCVCLWPVMDLFL